MSLVPRLLGGHTLTINKGDRVIFEGGPSFGTYGTCIFRSVWWLLFLRFTYHLFKRKGPFAILNFTEKGGGLIFEGGPFLEITV